MRDAFPDLSDETIEQLTSSAIAARENAYAPYSKFHVGAAALWADGQTVSRGCNVENASYGLSICAERAAICAAVASGNRELTAIAIAATPLARPCGACRQFIHEFGTQAIVICVDPQQPDVYETHSIESLIPGCFTLD